MALVGPLASHLARQASVEEADLGPLQALSGLALLFGGWPSGWLVDRIPGHSLLLLSELIQAVGWAIFPFCTSVFQLCIVYGFISITFIVLNTSLNTCSVWLGLSSEHLTALLNLNGMLFGVGALISPQLIYIFQLNLGYQGCTLVLYLVSGLSLLLAIGTCLLLPPSPSKPSSNQEAEEPLVEQDDENGEGNQLRDSNSSQKGARNRFSRLVFISSLLLLSLANCAIELGFSGWIFTFVVIKAGLGEGTGQQVTSLFWLSFMLGRLMALGVSSFISNSLILALSMPLAVIGPLLPLLLTPNLPVILTATALIGLGASTGVGCSLSMANDHLTLDGNLNGLIGTFVGIGATFFPVLVPSLAKSMPWIGWDWLMWATLMAAGAQLVAFAGMWMTGQVLMESKEESRSRRMHGEETDQEDINAPLLAASQQVQEE